MHIYRKKEWLFLGLLIFSPFTSAEMLTLDTAATPKESGLAIANAHKAQGNGWVDSTSELIMIIRPSTGNERMRRVTVKSLEVDGDGDRSLMVFSEPRDVSGTAFLSYSHVNKADDQWIFLPDLKRVKRISSNKKSGAFMGSEFAYEDLSSFEVAKYDFALIGEELLDGMQCYKIESYPKDGNSGYSRLVSWVDKQDLQFRQIHFYDRKDKLLKKLVLSDYRKFNDRFWRSERSVMTNHQTGSSTVLEYKNIALNTGLGEDDFSINSLKRAR